jgi:guanylate kinase
MENRLARLQEFQKILANYRISEESKQTLAKTKLALMVGPTSCGRNTIIRHLVQQGGYRFLVSDTTRAKRRNDGVMEQDGVEYWFRNEEDVLDDLRAGKFLEAAIIHAQQVSGISIRELERTIAADAVGITDIEIIGVDTIKELHPKADAFFVLPPSFQEWQQRLHHRGAMSDTEKRRRMESAVHEFSHALEVGFYHFVINDTVEHAAAQVTSVVSGDTNKETEQHGRELAIELLTETQYWLAKY